MAFAKIKKSYEMMDAKIQFVSLVNKAANKKKFLITKSVDGNESFSTYGKIIKADSCNHLVTGIVYEPMVEDTDGNFMTEEEITKAAHWFAKNGKAVDLQHCFEKCDGASVVESYVAKCDMEIEGAPIKKGTWVMTMEITDQEVWDAIEKGDLTGFSMGGVGKISTEDVSIDTIEKTVNDDEEIKEKKGFLAKMAALLGLEPIEKGRVEDLYKKRVKSENFWDAFYALQDCMYSYDSIKGEYTYESNPEKVEDALKDFNKIVTELLTDEESLFKSVKENPIAKAGKSLSSKNKENLQGIYNNLGEFLSKFENEENVEVTKSEITAIVAEVTKAMNEKKSKATPVTPIVETVQKSESEITEEKLTELIQKAVKSEVGELAKAMGYEEKQDIQPENDVSAMIQKAVQEAVAPLMNQAHIPTNLNSKTVQKSEESEHYLHGIL